MLLEQTDDFIHHEEGLKARGFVGIEGLDSMGKCHKNEKHYILRTDGMIIYTNWPWTHDVLRLDRDAKKYKFETSLYYIDWHMGNFSFKELDEVIGIVDL